MTEITKKPRVVTEITKKPRVVTEITKKPRVVFECENRLYRRMESFRRREEAASIVGRFTMKTLMHEALEMYLRKKARK